MSKKLTVLVEHVVEVADDFVIVDAGKGIKNDVDDMRTSVSAEMCDYMYALGCYLDAEVVQVTLKETYATR